MSDKTYNVLFLCTANSARSLMAEMILDAEGGNTFKAFSAGSSPAGTPNPTAAQLLARQYGDVSALRSKNWDVFAAPDAPQMDFVITVCDKAAGEVCPVWPGQPMSAHWGMPDPVSADGNDAQKAVIFAKTFAQLRSRITAFANLPIAELDKITLKQRVDEIAQIQEETV